MDALVRILHLDDNPLDAQLVALALDSERAKLATTIHYVQTKEAFLAALQRADFDLILSDYRMPDYDGDQALKAAQAICPDIPFIMVTGELGEELVIETLKRGATDYVLKDRIFRLIPAIRRALADAENRRKKQEAVREREELLREVQRSQGELFAIIQAMQGGVMVFDPEGRIILVNEAEAQILGYRDAAELRTNLAYFMETFELASFDGTVIPPAEWPASRVMRGETITNAELKARRKDTGQEWSFSISGRPVKDEAGRQILSVVVTRDITERRRAEEELHRAERVTGEVLESVKDPLYGLDKAWRFSYINSRAAEFLGKSPEEVLGHSLWELFPAVAGTDSERILRTAMETRVPQHHEFRSALKGAWVDVHVFPKADGGLSVLYRDISERKAQEKALRLSEERFSLAFRSGPYPLAISRVEDGVFLDMNEAFLQFYGMKKDEMIGRSSLDIGILADNQERVQLVERLRRDGTVHGFEMHVNTRTRGERVVLLSVSLLQSSEGQTMLTVIYDITAAKQAHGQLFEILENIQDAFYAVDAEWRFIYVNRKAEELWQKSREALLGKRLWEIFPEAAETSAFTRVAQAMRERKPVHFDVLSPVINRWVTAYLYPMADGGLSVYFREITEREKREALLQGESGDPQNGRSARKKREDRRYK